MSAPERRDPKSPQEREGLQNELLVGAFGQEIYGLIGRTGRRAEAIQVLGQTITQVGNLLSSAAETDESHGADLTSIARALKVVNAYHLGIPQPYSSLVEIGRDMGVGTVQSNDGAIASQTRQARAAGINFIHQGMIMAHGGRIELMLSVADTAFEGLRDFVREVGPHSQLVNITMAANLADRQQIILREQREQALTPFGFDDGSMRRLVHAEISPDYLLGFQTEDELRKALENNPRYRGIGAEYALRIARAVEEYKQRQAQESQ